MSFHYVCRESELKRKKAHLKTMNWFELSQNIHKKQVNWKIDWQQHVDDEEGDDDSI